MRSKLIVVEGIPGSGKTSMARFIHEWISASGACTRLFQEGNPDHPADFESVAYFNPNNLEDFLQKYEKQRKLLEQNFEHQGNDSFINYRKLRIPEGGQVPDDLFAELIRHDVYEVPSAELYKRLAFERWQNYAARAEQCDDIYVFECCLMQNPLAVLTLKHNQPFTATRRYIEKIMNVVQPLNPVLIYLRQDNVRQVFEWVALERPQEWKDYVTSYVEGGAWGRATGMRGFDSVIAYHAMRQRVELEWLDEWNIAKLVVDLSDIGWERGYREVREYLGKVMAG